MARYQIIFRNNTGRHSMLVDDPTREGEPLTYLDQPLKVGSTVKTNGNTWAVVDDTTEDGLRRIICDLAPVARLALMGRN